MEESLVPSTPAPSLRTCRSKSVNNRRSLLGRVTNHKNTEVSKLVVAFVFFGLSFLPLVLSECVLKQAELGFALRQDRHGHYVETVREVVEAVPRNVMVGCTNDASSFPMANRVFGRFGVLAGFHLDEYEDKTVPCDDVYLPKFGSISRSQDAVAERAEVINGEDFGSAAEGKKAVKEKREWQSENLTYAIPAIALDIVSTAKSACSSSITSGGDRRIVVVPAPRISRPRRKHSSMTRSRASVEAS